MKNVVLLLLVLLIISMSACNKYPPDNESNKTRSSLSESTADETSKNIQSETSILKDPELPIYVPGSIKLYPFDAQIWPNGKPYRDCWYVDPTSFKLGQTPEEVTYYLAHVERDPERMLCVQYIEYFKVSKEVFTAEMERLRKFYESSGADMSLEELELPNADIIYTFDDKIINYYYRYE